ncbi:signal peptidase II [Falsirhodobacter algicola]|uniref:Lipoprotein signal peptidase n=1 Tax=Falsirhodobacter algicola TaxID=2692330 RepID=A0A8J8MSN7_9RHOB|nr:signal peptidase II [Falsirhodobacter algicola]QUS36001.1 signal peptidase II [Falsirhodobacter algicola]
MRSVVVAAALTFALDQMTKLAVVHGMNLIQRGEIDVLPPLLTFRMAWNQGMNFGLFGGDGAVTRWILIAVAVGISGWVAWWMRKPGHGRLAQISAGLLIGGAMGNVVDRILYGAVADFLNSSCCGFENPYAFNVADIAIFAGAIGLVLFTGDPKPPRRRRKTA